MTGTEEGMMTEGGAEEMLRKNEAEGAETMTAEEMTTIAEEGGEMTIGESEGETMTGEDIMAMKELDMKSVGAEIGMKVGEDDQTEMEIIEERETGTAGAPRKETAEVQARGTIEEMIGAGREIMI